MNSESLASIINGASLAGVDASHGHPVSLTVHPDLATTGSNTGRKRTTRSTNLNEAQLPEHMPLPNANISASRVSEEPPAESSTQPKTRQTDRSKMAGSRSSGQPDVYDFQESPPRPSQPTLSSQATTRKRKSNRVAAVPKKRKIQSGGVSQDETAQLQGDDKAQRALASRKIQTRSSNRESGQEHPMPSPSSPKKLRQVKKKPVARSVSAELGDTPYTERTADSQSQDQSSQVNPETEAPKENETFGSQQVKKMMGLVRPIIVAYSGWDFKTKMAEAVGKATTTLKKAYEQFQSANTVNRRESADLQAGFKEKSDVLVRTVTKMLKEGVITTEKDDNERKDVLQDIYTHVVPGIVEVVNLIATMYPDGHLIPDSALEQILRLCKILRTILESATRQDKTVQPSGLSPPIVQSSKQLLPFVRELSKKGKTQLEARAAAVRAEEYRRGQSERKRKREEREHAVEESLRQRRNEAIHNMNLSLTQTRSRLGLPISPSPRLLSSQDDDADNRQLSVSEQLELCDANADRLSDKLRITESHIRKLRMAYEFDEDQNHAKQIASLVERAGSISEKLRRTHLKMKNLQKQQEVEGSTHHERIEFQEERVHIFGEHNMRVARRPWMRIEMEILIDGLRAERGPDRYRKLLTDLNRSIDEIYEKALEFKMTVEDRYRRDHLKNPRAYQPPLEDWIESIGNTA